MALIYFYQENFHYNFFEKRRVSSLFFDLPKTYDEFQVEEASYLDTKTYAVYCITNLPSYLGINRSQIRNKWRVIGRSYLIGFAMDLKVAPSAESYLRGQLGKKIFKNLRQDRQRLEKQCEIQFKVYHGQIDKMNYQLIMKKLYEFVKTRFKGRISKHAALQRWEHYRESVFDQINKGNASLFVIYNQTSPIAISLNYHFHEIFYAAITSFDSKYSSYSPGRQMFFRQIEWCYENGYRIIDMVWGNFDYKIRFANAVFDYETLVIYPRNNPFLWLLAQVYLTKLLVVHYLVMLKYRKFKKPKSKFAKRWMDYRIPL